MSAREWEQAKPAHRERRMPIMNEVHDIRSMAGYRKLEFPQNVILK